MFFQTKETFPWQRGERWVAHDDVGILGSQYTFFVDGGVLGGIIVDDRGIDHGLCGSNLYYFGGEGETLDAEEYVKSGLAKAVAALKAQLGISVGETQPADNPARKLAEAVKAGMQDIHGWVIDPTAVDLANQILAE